MKNLILIISLLILSYSNAQEITMFDEALGYRFYQDQERISFKEVSKLMLKDSLSALYWKRAKTKDVIIGGILTSQLIFIIAAGKNKISDKHYPILGPTFVISSCVNLGLTFSRQKLRRKAILRYNSLLDPPKKETEKVKLEVKPTLIFSQNNGTQVGLNIKIK